MIKPTLAMMTGLPASGKSTIAKNLSMLRFNLDDMRAMMGYSRDKWSDKQEEAVIETMLSGIDAALDCGEDVVVDNTHLTYRLPNRIRVRAAGRANFVVFDLLDVPVEECIKRDSLRIDSVGESVIRKMAKTSAGARKNGWKLTPEWMSIWPEVEPYHNNSKLPKAIIVDLDGTLAKHVARGPYDVKNLETDHLDEYIYNLIDMYTNHDVWIILLSGRKEIEDDGFNTREATERWLWANKVYYNDLFMRSAGDNRGDFIVKYELFNKHIRDKYQILTVLDDRDQVIRIWRQMKLPAWQVGYGNF